MIANSEARNLNSLVDSLYLRILRIAVPSQWLYSQYPKWRRWKLERQDDSRLFVEIPGLGSFEVKSFSKKPYEFILVNKEVASILIWNPDKWETAASSETGQFLVDFRSRYLQQNGLPGVRDFIQNLSRAFCCTLLFDAPNGWERISRVDLAVDTQIAIAPDWCDLERYVTRARDRDGAGALDEWEIERARELLVDLSDQQPPTGNKGCGIYEVSDSDLQNLLRVVGSAIEQYESNGYLYRTMFRKSLRTLYFGRFSSALHAIRYDKLASLKTQGKEYMMDIWKDQGWDGESPVWRTEFRLTAPFLRQAGLSLDTGEEKRDLRSFEDFCTHIPQIWQYLTTEWLTLRVPDEIDQNCARWELDPEWEEVQTAFPHQNVIDRKPPLPRPDDAQLMAQLKGVALSIVANRCQNDTDFSATRSVLHELGNFFSQEVYSTKVVLRRKRIGCDDYTHAALAMQLRAEWMIEGEGS
jgi:hypothetical protein